VDERWCKATMRPNPRCACSSPWRKCRRGSPASTPWSPRATGWASPPPVASWSVAACTSARSPPAGARGRLPALRRRLLPGLHPVGRPRRPRPALPLLRGARGGAQRRPRPAALGGAAAAGGVGRAPAGTGSDAARALVQLRGSG
jgi:hypothetical protein